ncbi:peptidase [Nitrosopumilus sp. S6]
MKILIFSISLLVLFSVPAVFAQHHGGEQAPPVSFGDGELTVSTTIFPADYTVGKDSSVNLNIRLFDTASNMNIESVTYRVQIFQGTQLVANQMFYDKDGELNLKIKPKLGCEEKELWKCTTYFGENDPIVPNALVSSASSMPVISGPVFHESGEYLVKTSIIGAKNPKTQTSEDIEFETTLFIPSEKIFTISINQNEYKIPVKNYQYPVTDMIFDLEEEELSFNIPFDWNHLEHTYHLKNSFEFPKSFFGFEEVYGFTAIVNDELVIPNALHYDTISKKNSNVIHFMIDQENLKKIKSNSNNLKISILPGNDSSFVKKEIQFNDQFSALIQYDSIFSQEKELTLSLAFFENGEYIENVRYGYSIIYPNGVEELNTGGNQKILGITLPQGNEIREFGKAQEGKYEIQLVLIGKDFTDLPKYLYSKFDLELIENTENAQKPSSSKEIPAWIKNNAAWWAEGSIDDSSFTKGLEFLIKEKIMNVNSVVETTSSSKEIPAWIKNNAAWWAEGSIDESSFVLGIEFLIKQGIIQVE